MRVRAHLDPQPWQTDEVDHERAKEVGMTDVYGELRAAGFSFEEMAEGNTEAMISWKLGWLYDRQRFLQSAVERTDELQAAWEAGEDPLTAGSAYSRYQAVALNVTRAKRLVEEHPALLEDLPGFKVFLRRLPTLRFPALLRAGLAATPSRKMKLGDGYDITHLTRGLSRCDVVTADSGMVQLIRDRQLVPTGCTEFGVRERDKLLAYLDAALGQ
jgi:hypothetical protein